MGPGHRHSQAYVKVQLGLRVGSLPSVALCVTFISGMASPECLLLSFWSTVMHTGRNTVCLIIRDHIRSHSLIQYRVMLHHPTSFPYPTRVSVWEPFS